MSLQIIQDNDGKPAGIFIPIDEWEILKNQYKDLEMLEYEEPSKEQILEEFKQALMELKQIEEGKLKSRSAKHLLDEL